jgi:hypothetical protein
MRAWRPIQRPQLTLRHRHARFDWSHDHLGSTIRTWRRVHWSDESRFLLRPTGHEIVWTASCCKKCCTIRALCGLALSSMNIGLSANAWLSKWGTTRGASTLSRYFWPTWSFGVDYSHMETGPLVWWKSFFVTPYRRSSKGLAPTKHFISGQPHFGHNCFWGWGCNCLGLFKITVLNSSIFWHFGLRWLIFRPIKPHTCSIGFMSGDIAGHVIVWTASCCKKMLLVWWKSFFVTPYRRSCKGLAPTKHFISGQQLFEHNCLLGWGCNCLGLFFLPTPKGSCAQKVVVLKWSVSLAPNPCTTVGRA